MDLILMAIVGLVTLAVGFGAGYALRQRATSDPIKAAEEASEALRLPAAGGCLSLGQCKQDVGHGPERIAEARSGVKLRRTVRGAVPPR